MRDRRGFALIVALWLLVALSAAALEFSLRGRARRLAAANAQEEVVARAAADAGLAHARARFQGLLEESEDLGAWSDPVRAADPWGGPIALLPDSAVLGEGRYRVGFRDAGSALNLNRVEAAELLRLLLVLRVDAGRAERITDAVLDWRDADDLRHGRGAERNEYLRAGARTLPRNAPFQSLLELSHVLGMTPEIFARVEPHLTLHGSGQVNLNSASGPVLLALPGMSDEAVQAVMRIRRQGRRVVSLADLAEGLSPSARGLLLHDSARLRSRVALETREVEVRAEGWMDGGRIRAEVEAVLARGGRNAFVVWRREVGP